MKPIRSKTSLRTSATIRRRNVALIIETSVVYGRQILRGIARHLKTHAAWSVFLDERELRVPPPDWLSHWRGDGVICRSTTPEWAQIFRRRHLPVVDLNDLHLGRSPQAERRAVRLRRVQQLLAETDWTLPRIAEAAGIEHPEYLSVVFKRETGQTPGQFRQARQARNALDEA